MFARMFREAVDYAWSMTAAVEDERRAAGEWSFSYTVSDAIPRSAGRAVRFGGMSLFELENGKIRAYREYANLGAALLQLGFSPEAMAKVIARRLP
jgi:predicted ester cyclase